MTRQFLLILTLLTIIKTSAQQTVTIKASNKGSLITPTETISEPNNGFKLVIDGKISIDGDPVLRLKKNNNSSSVPSTRISKNSYTFDSLQGGRKDPDSMFISMMIKGKLQSVMIFEVLHSDFSDDKNESTSPN